MVYMRNDYRFKETHQSSGGLGFMVLLMIIGIMATYLASQPKPVVASRVYVMETVPMAKAIRQERDYLARANSSAALSGAEDHRSRYAPGRIHSQEAFASSSAGVPKG
jgi:hypothetical protein